uniref:Uncharacterized protein n=1 Tax=Triticum urartu TaxID=4572 RepID=A0A8R7V3D2_TRIUA
MSFFTQLIPHCRALHRCFLLLCNHHGFRFLLQCPSNPTFVLQ